MKTLTNGQCTIEVEELETEVQVFLAPHQYQQTQLPLFESFLISKSLFFEGKIKENNEEQLVLSYSIPKEAKNLSDYLLRKSKLERLETAQKLNLLQSFEVQDIHIFMHPENLFLVGGRLKVAHRGCLNIVEPFTSQKEEFFGQYKALVASTIQPKYSFDSLLEGSKGVRDSFTQEILDAETFEQISVLLDEAYTQLSHEQQQSKRLVKKSWDNFFKAGVGIFAVAAVGFGIWSMVLSGSVVPKQNRIIDSQTAFLSNNYDKATETLEKDKPDTLPKSAQYVLANSYIHLDNLTNEQKTAILSNLSFNSSANELVFWIYLGRGDFKEALNIAKNIGDNQLILHAYTKLYDATNADTKMSGNKKQELLGTYKKEIDEYMKRLGGKADGIEKNK